jgi:glucosylceramidase
MGGTTNNPAATKLITNPTNLRGTLAERTGSVKVTSQDGTATKTYKIVFTISEYIYKVGFATTGNDLSHMPGWRSAYTTTSNTVPMGNHDYFPGTAAMKFVRGQSDKIGYLNTAKYIKSDSLFFWLAVENPDGVENLLVEKKVGGGVKIMVDNITSSKMSGEWQLFKYKIGETDSTEIIFTPTLTSEGATRIWIDDLALKGKKVGGTVAVKETAGSLISVYPNPASDQLNVIMHKAPFTSVEVYDLTGRPVMKRNIEKDAFSLNISNLPRGVYMITFRDGIRSSSQRFVKIK